MKTQLDPVKQFHQKFHAPVGGEPSLIPPDRYRLRHKLMSDEVAEYLEGVQKGDLDNVAKELADILYAVYGTILEHGLQDKMEEIFDEVHRSNMSKDYHQYKMVKGAGYFHADVKKVLEKKL